MKNRIITISREFGSGGRTIGRQAAEKLGIPCYDAELIQKLAEESGFSERYIKEAGEYVPHGFLSFAFSNRSQGPTNEDVLWDLQYKVITELAENVGRCADYILREKADCLKVFIHADMAFRAERIVKVYGEREQSPEQRLRDQGQAPRRLPPLLYGYEVGPRQNYHITLNSGVLGIDRCAEIICELF